MASGSKLLLSLLLCYCLSSCLALNISYDEKALLINGERKIIISGSIHYPRSTPEMWPSLIRQAKEGGLNAIETYVFWNAHEPIYRQYDFSGNLDLVRFIRTIHDNGLYSILRLGPYVCAEWNYGGFPVWLENIPGVTFRTENEGYMREMKNFTTLIVDMMRNEGLYASQGGPIILSQIENEYGNIMNSYGNDGKSYINWCADLAHSYDIGIPWIMCQQDYAPNGIINTCNGYYCDQFFPSHKPKMWTENWTGWFKNWGSKDPHRTAEDLAFAVARFFQYGGALHNYYMYHGGSNFGRTAGGPYITTSYDYDAPLNEYGNLNQPKWGHLKRLHELLLSHEKYLTDGVSSFTDYGNWLGATVFSYRGKRFCLFGNAHEKEDQVLTFEGTNYSIPAWSVSVLPDCYEEVYNTAKINTQTSIMVKHPNDADNSMEPYNLQWSWRYEPIEHLKFKHKHHKKNNDANNYSYANQLLEQKKVTNDTSDYLWYMTSVELDHNDSAWKKKATVQVHSKGHVLHVFVNEKHIGTKYSKVGEEFDFEAKFTPKHGNNSISLLSVTVGLQNYGAYFDKVENGIVGPVRLIGNNNDVKDLQNNKWTYMVGVRGMDKKLYEKETEHHNTWHVGSLPTDKMFVWYKTTFKAPLGDDPVVLDLMGMGKGTAWVNGFNIGRYWPSHLIEENDCDYKCDYRGSYYSSKCGTGCGESSQRWYHVPRSILNDDDNLLVLFEEFGGNPGNVKVQTVTIGKVCGNAYEGNKLELSCQGGNVISEIKFASFGDPRGTCGAFEKGSCESPDSESEVEKACVGKESCVIDASDWTFEPSGCKLLTKRLAVEALCS